MENAPAKTRKTEELPLKIHNLKRLMECAELPFEQSQENLLHVLNSYCMEGRYANEVASPPTPQRAMELMRQSQEMRT